MRQAFLPVICLFCVLNMSAQSAFSISFDKEGKLIAIPKPKTYHLTLPDFDFNTYLPSSTVKIDTKILEFIPEYSVTGIAERPMNMQILSEAYRPYFNVYRPMLQKVNPIAFDFNEISITPLNENLLFAINGRQYTWPGAGGLTTINPAMIWQANRLTVTGGGFASRFFTPFNLSPEYSVGLNTQLRYDLHERVALRAWGQYAHFFKQEDNNPHLIMNPFFYQTNIGGAAEFKITDDFGIGMGVNYEYNPRRRRLEPQYLLYPVFGNGKFQVRMY